MKRLTSADGHRVPDRSQRRGGAVGQDVEVAAVWRLHRLADASRVGRTLAACTEQTVAGLEGVLDGVDLPFLDRAVGKLRQRQVMLVLDADLIGRPVSSTSQAFPGAAFGYMDGEARLGDHLAEICLHTVLFGRQWLSAQHHIRLDAGFTTGANLIETAVGKNTEVLCWPGYQVHGCRYPLLTGLERFHTLKGVLHAALIRCQDDPPRPISI